LETSESFWLEKLASGPDHVPPSTYPIAQDFLRAAETQDIPIVDDLQDLKTGHGAEQWLKWINRDVSPE